MQGNAKDLSHYSDNDFDILLLFGSLYHFHDEADRQKCIEEAKRVCKPDSAIFFAFISNDMVVTTKFSCDVNWFKGDSYKHNSFDVEDFPFVFFTFDKCVEMLKIANVNIIYKEASDGLSEFCEKTEMIGNSNHLLFVGTK